MLNHVLNALSAVGNVMDLPGSTFRDFVSGRNPFDQWLTPWHEDAGNRASGRDVLRSWNHGLQAIGGPSLISDHDTWGNFGAGLAAETLLDPTNLLFGSGLKTPLRANRNVRGFNAAQSAANADSIMKRARGFFPEENISKLHPALLTVDPKTGATVPKVMHHGTPHAYDNITEDVIRNNHENLQGAGHYTSESQKVTGGPDGYWTKGMEHPRTEYKVRDAEGLGSAYKKLLADSNMEDAAKLDALSNHHAAFDALEEMTHPDEWHYKDQLYGKGWQEKLLPHIDVIHTPGSPSNVRMAYFDIRNPFDIEAMHDVKNIKIPERLQGQPEVRIVKKPDGTFGHEPVPPLTLEKIRIKKLFTLTSYFSAIFEMNMPHGRCTLKNSYPHHCREGCGLIDPILSCSAKAAIAGGFKRKVLATVARFSFSKRLKNSLYFTILKRLRHLLV